VVKKPLSGDGDGVRRAEYKYAPLAFAYASEYSNTMKFNWALALVTTLKGSWGGMYQSFSGSFLRPGDEGKT
jgi:hypothetical protein